MPIKHFSNSNANNIQQNCAYMERPRLHKLLFDAMNFPLVAVYAGSGYGKTRMTYSFLQKYDAHTTWMQITERDNIAARFWESFAHMLTISWPQAEARLLEIGFPETDEAFLKFEAMIRESEAITGKHIMVYDDFHLLVNPAILRFFERAINTLPQSATIILISRTMPEVNITGMMLRERIFTIQEEALIFTEDEIAAYFEQSELSVTRQDIRDIYEDTRGWAFAVNLIARALRKDRKYERYALEAVKENIFKLIEADVSPIVSKPLWRFLLRISLIDHLAANLIKELACDDSLIREMETINAFIRYDSHMGAYMIHHLFLDYMRQHQHILTDEEKRVTYEKASKWCEKNNFLIDALSYYEKAGDYSAILRLAHSFDAQMPHEIAGYILDILNRIPKNKALQNPLFPVMQLKLMTNLGLTDESLDLARRYADYYEAQPESQEKDHALAGIYGAWGILSLLLSPYSGIYDFDVYFEKQSVHYDKNPYSVLDTLKSQPLSAWSLLVGSGRAGAPEEYIGAAARSTPHISRVMNGNFYGYDDLVRGELSFFRWELHDAELYLKQAYNKARERSQHDIQSRSLLYLMHIAFARGDLAAADELLSAMKKLLDETGCAVRCATIYDVSCGLYHLTLGQADHVPEWLKGEFSPYTHPAFLDNYANLVKAKYHYQTMRYSALLAFIESDRERQALLLCKIELKVLAALSLYQLKKRQEAIDALSEAYFLAEPNNIIMPFIQYRKDMRTLTAAAMRDAGCPIPKPWLEGVNRKASALAKRQAHMISKYKAVNNIENEISLTAREIEILKDVSLGLSRNEIAVNRNISANTVKAAFNIIYEKLHANNMFDAIRIAAERKII